MNRIHVLLGVLALSAVLATSDTISRNTDPATIVMLRKRCSSERQMPSTFGRRTPHTRFIDAFNWLNTPDAENSRTATLTIVANTPEPSFLALTIISRAAAAPFGPTASSSHESIWRLATSSPNSAPATFRQMISSGAIDSIV